MEKSTFKIEREHKFLVDTKKLFKAVREIESTISIQEITQGYLTGENDSVDVRLRSIDGNDYFLTLKEGKGFERPESENRITKEVFENLWLNVKGRIIEKTRYKFNLKTNGGEFVAELDVYKGRHKGLVILEIEVEENVSLEGIKLPEWIKEDVTENEKYSNRYLACKGMPNE